MTDPRKYSSYCEAREQAHTDDATRGVQFTHDAGFTTTEDPGPWLKRLRVFLRQAPLRFKIWLAYGRCSGCGARDTQTRYVGSWWFGRRRRYAMCRQCWRADV